MKAAIKGANMGLVGSDNSVVEVDTDSLGKYFFDSTMVKPNTTYVVRASGLDAKNSHAPDGYLGNPKWKFTTKEYTESYTFTKDLELKIYIKPIQPEQPTETKKPIVRPSNTKCGNCLLLQKALETTIFKNWGRLCRDSSRTLTLIDTSRFFQNCGLKDICIRKIELSNEPGKFKGKNIFQLGNNQEQYMNFLIVFIGESKNKIYSITFFQPVSNQQIVLKYKCGKNKIKLKRL